MKQVTAITRPTSKSKISDDNLVGFFNANINALKPSLDLSVKHLDERANANGFNVINASESELGVWIEYEVEFSAYYGCKDKNYSGTDQRELNGIRNGDTWEFDIYTPFPERDTYEEF